MSARLHRACLRYARQHARVRHGRGLAIRPGWPATTPSVPQTEWGCGGGRQPRVNFGEEGARVTRRPPAPMPDRYLHLTCRRWAAGRRFHLLETERHLLGTKASQSCLLKNERVLRGAQLVPAHLNRLGERRPSWYSNTSSGVFLSGFVKKHPNASRKQAGHSTTNKQGRTPDGRRRSSFVRAWLRGRGIDACIHSAR